MKRLQQLLEDKLGNIRNAKVSIDIKDLDLHGTIHSKERQTRADNQGRDITVGEIVADLNKAIPAIMNDYANGELANNASFLIHNTKSNLNVIASIRMQKGKDFIKVITVMRKADFKIDPTTTKYQVR